MKTTFTFVLLLWMSGVSAQEKHRLDRYHKQFSISQATNLKVINPYGDLRLRKADDDQLIFHGVAQSNGDQTITIEYHHEEKGQIEAVVKHSHPNSVDPTTRFDLALIVPPQVNLDIEFEGGGLSSKGLASDLKIHSQDGDIKVKTSGAVDVFSKTGDIDVILTDGEQVKKSQIQSHTGAVTIKYSNALTRFEIITGDHITSNSAQLLADQKQLGRTHIFGSDPDVSKHLIDIKTDTGSIRLIKLNQKGAK